MVTVKLIVILFTFVNCAAYSKYCKICMNHILCQYPTPGPGVSCKEYDRNTFLTDDDIYDLVNQINERRNFIALGHSRQLPSAANMNKLVWSEELARFAQRWVDQCDPSLRPDKEDQCRDLEDTNVGQNIASIINPSPKFSIRSFIEMWFMRLLDYRGSVTYYDQFQDNNSKYFTQLIWAETESVGCGRAKFNVNDVSVERLVCNFSPKGNIHGKPVYTIGYARTQCLNQVAPNEKFKGLCMQGLAYNEKLPAASLPVSSLLKILNLSNDSVKQEMDPIYNNMKQFIQHRNVMEGSKHQRMRHIFGNKPYSRRPDFLHRLAQKNVTRNHREHFNTPDTKISGLDHVYRYKDHTAKGNKMEILRKHDKAIYLEDNFQNFNNFKKQCTRSTECYKDCGSGSKAPLNQNSNQCTRGPKTNWEIEQNTNLVTNAIQHEVSHDFCPCSVYNTAYPSTSTQRMYKLNCECAGINGLTIRCPNLPRTLQDNRRNIESEISFKDSYSQPEDENAWLNNKDYKKLPQNKRSRYIQNNRNRRKRDFGNEATFTFKPFWQIDSYSSETNPQLKSLRYTTLANRRQQKTKKYPLKIITTESITLSLKNSKMKPVTEKYLSFDELLHLRKLNLSANGRRQNEPQSSQSPAEEKTTPTTESTTTVVDNSTEYTANTPFKRMKHCTRKLTCTWTAASLTDSNGSIIPGGSGNQGSRTPPGYVEGCTRTSTCTRDYMNRNKFQTTVVNSTNDYDDGATNDGDYCERRSLELRKRNFHKKRSFYGKYPNKRLKRNPIKEFYNKEVDYSTLKSKNLRKKRNPSKSKITLNKFSYGDVYYMVLHKILKEWEHKRLHVKQCPCSRTSARISYLQIILVICSFPFLISRLCLL